MYSFNFLFLNYLFNSRRVLTLVLVCASLVGCGSFAKNKNHNQIESNRCHPTLQQDMLGCYEKKVSVTFSEQTFEGPSGDEIFQQQCQVHASSGLTHIASVTYFDNKLGLKTLARLDQNGTRQIIFGKDVYETVQLECIGEWRDITTQAISVGSDIGLIPWGGQLKKYVGGKKCNEVRRRYRGYPNAWKKRKDNTLNQVVEHCGYFKNALTKAFGNR